MIQEFGEYLVADAQICHGKLTFRGTRVFVSDVLDQVASGMNWDEIIAEWHGSIGRDAIADAVRFAKDALIKQTTAPTSEALTT